MKRRLVTSALLWAGCEQALAPHVPVSSIIITPDTATVIARSTLQLQATLLDSAGHPLSGRAVTWSSSNRFVATVSSTGLVTGLGQGRTTITAAAAGKIGTAGINVFAPVASVTVDQGNHTIVVGGSVQLTATPRDWQGIPLSGRVVSWSSSDTATAVVTADGLVMGRARGAVTIAATSEGQSGEATVRVAVVSFLSLSASPTAHTCGVSASGAAFCWGSDALEQLGNGAAGAAASPIGVRGEHAFESVSGGGTFTCGLTTGSAAYCWGNGARGRLGNGSSDDSAVPVAVSGGLTLASLGTGASHACGVTVEGTTYCWGSNGNLQLGNDTAKWSFTPVRVNQELQAISAGGGFTCGLSVDGTAYCWGTNHDGQLGSAGPIMSAAPLPVSSGLAFAALKSGVRHSCALTAQGAAYCWGHNVSGELGNGATLSSATPVAVASGLTFTAISAGLDFTCGVATDGTAFCWGDNSSGQLGSAATTESCAGRPCSTVPLPVSGGLSFASVTAGDAHACGVTTDGIAYCWGSNSSGQLGDGTTTDRAAPIRVLGQP